MKWLRILLCIGLLSIPIPAPTADCPGITTTLKPFGYDQLAVSSVAVSLTIPSNNTRQAVIMVEDNAIRFRDDGNVPTDTVGTKVQANVTIVVCGLEVIKNFQAIRVTGDATLSINYYGG